MAVLAAWMAGACGARAAVITNVFTDLTSWQSAATATATVTFDGIASGTTAASEASPYSADGIVFSETPSANFTIWDTGPGSYFTFNTGGILFSMSGSSVTNPVVTVTLPANTTAVAFNLVTINNPQTPVDVAFNGGAPVVINQPAPPAEAFYGVTATAPITTVTFTFPSGTNLTNGTQIGLDNFAVGTAGTVSSTPEAATLLMIGIGLATMKLMRRRTHATAAAA